jgi:mono/diheme cytochrome c family protein
MKHTAIPIVLALGAFAIIGAGNLHATADSGKSIFLDNKCAKCHSIESQGIKRSGPPPPGGKLPPDLSGVGLKHTAEWMQKWQMKEVEMNGKKHMKKFAGTSDELVTLTTWLATLKTKTP